MKKRIFLIIGILFILFVNLYSQTVEISGQKDVEVGIEYTYTATVYNFQKDDTIKQYEWIVEKNGKDIGGQSNIKGDNSVEVIETSDTSAIFKVKWGDSYESCGLGDKIEVTVSYTDVYYTTDNDGNKVKHTNEASLYGSLDVTIMWLETPNINPKNAVQRCCTDDVKYCAEACKGDDFTWTVSGGTFPTSQQGNKCITVTPTALEDIKLSVRARRKSGVNNYFRDWSLTIGRVDPVTPPIQGPGFVCKGETSKFCINQICGMTGANWSVPPSLSILSGVGTNCIEVTPNSSTPNGSVASISVVAIMTGGCYPPKSTESVSIYEAETPPYPDGEVIVTPQGEVKDPCDPESWPEFTVKYITDHPYVNGTTSVSPKVFIPVPHHMNENATIIIRVCNINFCSGKQTCRDYIYELPYPCEDDKYSEGDLALLNISNNNMNELDTILNTFVLRDNVIKEANEIKEKLQIFPNPFSNSVKINFPYSKSGTIEIFDISGKLMYDKDIKNSNSETLRLEEILKDGIYFIRLNTEEFAIIKKLIHKKR